MYNIKKIMLFVISLAAIAFVSCVKYFTPVLQLILFTILSAAFLIFVIYLIVKKIPLSMIVTTFLVAIGGLSELASNLIYVFIKHDQSIIDIGKVISPVSLVLGFTLGSLCVVRYGTKRDRNGGFAGIVALVIVGCIFLYIVS